MNPPGQRYYTINMQQLKISPIGLLLLGNYQQLISLLTENLRLVDENDNEFHNSFLCHPDPGDINIHIYISLVGECVG
jgi:hypothetical protein